MDLTDPAVPTPIASVAFTEEYATRIYVADSLAYIIHPIYGLEIFDVHDPLHPVAVGKYRIRRGSRNDVFAVGDYAYVTYDDGRGHLIVLDVSDPAHPRQVGGLTTSGTAERIFVVGDTAYVADGGGGLLIIDVSNPAAPKKSGHFTPPAGTSSEAVFVDGTTVYLGSNGPSGVWLQRIDVSDPAHPSVMGQYSQRAPKQVRDIEVLGGYVYAAVRGGCVWELLESFDDMEAEYESDWSEMMAVYGEDDGIYAYPTGDYSNGLEVPLFPHVNLQFKF